jgi:hypothetical protein
MRSHAVRDRNQEALASISAWKDGPRTMLYSAAETSGTLCLDRPKCLKGQKGESGAGREPRAPSAPTTGSGQVVNKGAGPIERRGYRSWWLYLCQVLWKGLVQ